jgi:hypothetical protein
MTMHRDDVEGHVEEAVSCPVLSRRLQKVVEEIEETVPGDRTKEMMYELVDIVLQMGQRVRALETRVVSYDVNEQLSMQSMHGPKRKIDYAKDFPSESEHAKERK